MAQLIEGQLVARRGKYSITVAPPHQRQFKFNFVHDDYDGPGDLRCGFGRTVEECHEYIDALELCDGCFESPCICLPDDCNCDPE